ncbi:TlpA family protein disulfide reductase [Filimonas effusa]|uniref:TlpA family protein disulfide reductase n=1 Tax=Filimonas effusa TaxID=2508721 RepID=A0A4Q1DDF1_9BACT|nr:TlpA disulfide reductase family protein [Filimonas effusa]RXK86998.1 TlpA family protein disulfide reductase [Filimonas effusa]
MKYISWLLVFCISALNIYGQHITPLRVGDTVPDITIGHLLNYPSDTARLSDFKGKLIILDFWATWCGPCVSSLPKMFALQKRYKGKIQIITVTGENKNLIQTFLTKKNAYQTASSTVFATGDIVLSQYFKHTTIPHEVWIDENLKVRAITSDQYVSSKNIDSVLGGKMPNWVAKEDSKTMNLNENGLFSSSPKIDNSILEYHSGLTNFIKGATSSVIFIVDSSRQQQRMTATNFSKLVLYSLAYQKFPVFNNPKMCMLNVTDSSKFLYDFHTGYRDVWKMNNWHSYESVASIHCEKKELQQKMVSDLDFYFGLRTTVEKRNIMCWVLKNSKRKVISRPAKGFPQHALQLNSQGGYVYNQKNLAVNELIETMNTDSWFSELPLAINETSDSTPIDMTITIKQKKNINQWNSELKKYGLELVQEQRIKEMLIVNEL